MSELDMFTLTASLTSLCLLCFIIGVVVGERDDPNQPKPKKWKKQLDTARGASWHEGYCVGERFGKETGYRIGYEKGWNAAKNCQANNQKLEFMRKEFHTQ